MPVYTEDPLPTYLAQQIKTQADGDAWVASLTDNELRQDDAGVVFSNVRVEVGTTEFSIIWVRTDTLDGSYEQHFEAPLGGYALARQNGNIGLWPEDEENFNRRFALYQPPCPPEEPGGPLGVDVSLNL